MIKEMSGRKTEYMYCILFCCLPVFPRETTLSTRVPCSVISFVFGLVDHSFPQLRSQRLSSHPLQRRGLYFCNTVRVFCPILHSILSSPDIQMIFKHLRTSRLTLYALKFYEFSSHGVMYPPSQYHTEQSHHPKTPLRVP